MLETISPKLINPPGGDPGLLVALEGLGESLLFDVGANQLKPGELLRVSHLFISHAHVDHWIGFDRLLRMFLGKDAVITVFGPPGITGHLHAKLSAYVWNLWFDQDLRFVAQEVQGDRVRSTVFSVKRQFRWPDDFTVKEHQGLALQGDGYQVSFAVLDHAVDCLAFSLQEQDRFRFCKQKLMAMGISEGPHLAHWKQYLKKGMLSEQVQAAGRSWTLGALAAQLGEWVRGKKVVYITDTGFTRHTVRGMLGLAHGADVLYCEATFPESDREKAQRAKHLTAGQAGALARAAGVQTLVPFHFSKRYAQDPSAILQDVKRGLRGELRYPELESELKDT